jgi:fructose-1-phosphate kinase PfkB-like protein
MRGENRVAYSIYDPEANQLTELIEDTDGPVDGSTLKALMEKIKELLDTISSIVLSGRAPVGFPENGYRLILEIANRKNLPVYLDCYGPLLQQAINSCPFLLKINRSEASNFLDQKLSPDGDLFEAGKKILSLGVRNVIITSGARGAVLVTREGEWLVEAPPLKGAAVGSGDAMLAGLISQISQGKTLSEALRFGAAVGSANVKIPGAGLFLVEDVHEIIKEVILSIHGPPTFLGEK